jgi:S-adenosylmethionine:tRNA ribosyltransferase-isomerase
MVPLGRRPYAGATVDTDAFDYPLPREAIAQRPPDDRDGGRLLVDRGEAVEPGDRLVTDLPELLAPGDLLVVNDTRVRAARLPLRKRSGGAAEVLLLERDGDGWWQALVRPSRRLPAGTVVVSEVDDSIEVEIGDDLGAGRRRVRFSGLSTPTDEEAAIVVAGQLPMPPYVTHPLRDPERYQTVYASVTSSAAAPTAGLHLTDELLARCQARGIEVATVELAIGLDTFRPMVAGKVADHRMHAEQYRVPQATTEACARAGRVVAVGTTVVRALESAVMTGENQGRTDLFIKRGHRFASVDVLLTNFHLPRSTLLVMVDAFIGPRWRALYDHALAQGYRFLSFGDAMLLTRAVG